MNNTNEFEEKFRRKEEPITLKSQFKPTSRASNYSLSKMVECLDEMVDILEAMQIKHIPNLAETKKAAQSSIIELCAVISEVVKED